MASIWRTKHSVALLGAGCGAAVPFFAPVVMASDEKKSSSSGNVRPSQLPIYDDPEDLFDISYEVAGKGQLQEGVEVVRKELCGAIGATKEFRDEVTHIYETGKAHTAGQIAYLREDENVAARSGAIAVGGVLGLMLGARGRFFKKLLYTSAGAAGTAAALYPQYSRQYTQEALDAANSYSTVAYNFLFGVKPQTTKDESADPSSAAAAAASASKAGGKVEVSNLYPSLLTLPHSRLFTKKEEKNYWPYTKAVKKGPIVTQSKSLEQIAEEASQVSTLGFRLQERESDPVQGFGSVAEPAVGKDDSPISSVRGDSEAPSSNSFKGEDKVEGEPPLQERSSEPQSSSEGIEKGSDEKFIDKLIDETRKVVEFADRVEKDAKLVEKITEQVETVSEVIPVIGDKIESVAEFVEEAATVVEEIADKVKHVAETVEVLEEARRESASTAQFIATENQAEREKKTSLFEKVSNFFSSSDPAESVSSNLTASPSTASNSALKTDPGSSLEEDEKQSNTLSDPGIPELAHLPIIEPVQESEAALRKDPVSEPSYSAPAESDGRIPEANESTTFSEKLEVLPQKSDLTISEGVTESAARNTKEIAPVEAEDNISQSSLEKDSSEEKPAFSETDQAVQEVTDSKKLSEPAKSEVAIDAKPEEKPSLFNKIADFFNTDSSATEKSSPKSDLNDNNAAEIEKPATSASNATANLDETGVSNSDATAVSVVQKPEIPDALLKSKRTLAPSRKEASSPVGESEPSGNDKPKPQVVDTTKSSVPVEIAKPLEASEPSDALVKTAPPNPSVAEICEPETRSKERETFSRVRDEGGLMIIESPGSEDAFAALHEASKNEPKESPSEVKTPAEDHGQSNPSDADMYTTRS